MKVFFIYFVLLITFSNNAANAQKGNPENLLKQLPDDVKLDKSVVRTYRMTTDYYDYDLKSNFLVKKRLTGFIIYSGDSALWKDVYYAESKTLDAEFPRGVRMNFLHDFKYQPDGRVLTADFFKNNLPEADPLTMNLIWDALGFDVLAYCCWDSLTLIEEFRATNMNSEFKLADIGTFENKDIRIAWLGITEINGEICAVLKYSVMNNPLNIEFKNISMSGRSHYWGEIYVSLSDKQIEYANLSEDVVHDTSFKGQANNIQGYTVRTIKLSRIE
ncbi:MAG: hypothetical protein LBH60_01135 [Prevotellaceae bacterium]|jgi:hypothetical protein|nr:hypothetical protein [Prevotellaceae bacterium]